MNTAIIAAAGSGKRFRASRPKQFFEVLGKPIIVHTLERFEACTDVSAIIVVLAADEIENFKNLSGEYGFVKIKGIVRGGNTRAESVSNGLAAADPATNIVAVHDGARPLVSVAEISSVIQRADEMGAACLVAPVSDTIKEIENDVIIRTLDRRHLRRALTPQAFRYRILREAFDASDLGEDVTDECFLVEKLGCPIAAVAGNPQNIKITGREDILFAEAALRNEIR